MKNEAVYRETFIQNVIDLVAEGGFEAATTRAITSDRKQVNDVKLNEAHIYRVFGTKENLFAETFAMLDDEMLSVISKGLSVFDEISDFRNACEKLFLHLWKFLLQNEAKCRYYTRYYYSAYFKNSSYKNHIRKYELFLSKVNSVFKQEANIQALFHNVISMILNFAILVYNGAIGDNEDTQTHVFNVAYASIAPYLKH